MRLLKSILVVLLTLATARADSLLPIYKGRLITDLDGNGKQITNLWSISATNYIDANTGLPLSTGGSPTGGITSAQGTNIANAMAQNATNPLPAYVTNVANAMAKNATNPIPTWISQYVLTNSTVRVYNPETFGALGSALTNDDGPAWQAAWYAAADASNVVAVIDGRGRTYNIATTVHSDKLAYPWNQQVTIQNAAFQTATITAGFSIWSNSANYTVFKDLYFGIQTNANVASSGLKLGSLLPNQNAYCERVQLRNLVITNFAIGVDAFEQDNLTVEGCRIWGCRSNSFKFFKADQFVIKSTYWGFGWSGPLAFGTDFYTGTGIKGWETNQIGITGWGGVGGLITDGCACNFIRQAIYWDGGTNQAPVISIIGQNDFEAILAPPGMAVIQVTNNVTLNIQNLMGCCSSNSLIFLEMNNCNVQGTFIQNPPTYSGGLTNDISLFNGTGSSPYNTAPRVIGANNGFTINYHSTYRDAGIRLFTIPGGNVVTTTAQNVWNPGVLSYGVGEFFDTALYIRRGQGDDADFVVGADAGGAGAPTSSGNTLWGMSALAGGGGINSLLGYQDYTPGSFYKLLIGSTTQTPRASPTEIHFYGALAYGANGVDRMSIDKGSITVNATNGSAMAVFNANGVLTLSAAETNSALTGGVVAADTNGKRKIAALSGITWDGTTLTASGSGGGIATVQTNGVNLGTSQTTINFINGANTTVTGNVSGATSTISFSGTAGGGGSVNANSNGTQFATSITTVDLWQGTGLTVYGTNRSGHADWTITAAPSLDTNNGTLTANILIGDGGRGVVNGAASGAVPVDANGSATTFAQVIALQQANYPFLTNWMTTAIGLTNNANVFSGIHTNQGGTANRMAFHDSNLKLIAAAASGAVPLNADGSSSTFAQLSALAPGGLFTNTGSATPIDGNNTATTFAQLSALAPGGLFTNTASATPINGNNTATTFAQVNALAPSATPFVTNQESVAITITNSANQFAGNFTNTSGTANRMAMYDANLKLVAGAASGAVPVNADGSASTFAQVNALAPSATPFVTNQESVAITITNSANQFAGNFTNSAATASGVAIYDASKKLTSTAALPGSSAVFLDGTGAFSTPAGGGGGVSTIQTNGVNLGTGITSVNFINGANTTVTGAVSGASVTLSIQGSAGGGAADADLYTNSVAITAGTGSVSNNYAVSVASLTASNGLYVVGGVYGQLGIGNANPVASTNSLEVWYGPTLELNIRTNGDTYAAGQMNLTNNNNVIAAAVITNAAATALGYANYDANKKLTSTFDGGGLTNITKQLPFMATAPGFKSTAVYIPFGYSSAAGLIGHTNVAWIAPACTLSNLQCCMMGVNSSTNLAIAVFTNEVASAITASANGLTGGFVYFSDTTAGHATTITNGTRVELRLLGNNTSASAALISVSGSLDYIK